ncbi:MAG: ComEC/Rec2 family competence protein [Prevotella sp.]|nr:ComEC/Rec2 family competence protein [Prevotella sp.]
MKRPVFEHCPLLIPALCLAIGIALGDHIPHSVPMLPVLLAAIAVTLLAGRWPLVQSLGVSLCFTLLGMTIASKDDERLADGVWTEAVVASPPTEKPKTMMADLLLPSTGERRRCFIWKDERSQGLDVGDNLLVCIRDSQFISRDSWHRGGDGFSHLSNIQRLRLRALQWRSTLVQRIISPDDDSDAQAVLSAMVLGDKSELSKELRATYSATGASHILALSGLHLGIIYLLLTQLTLGRRRLWLTQVPVVLGIWAFALITGLSTSVVRAAMMISLYAVFSLGGRRQSPLGVLSFTAIIMLLFNSDSLYDIGFQLSFMAMLGILVFVPLFERMVSIRWLMEHRVVKWLMAMMTMSVAAQLTTAPLVAYHFGRFSTYFLLTNLLAIPIATLILYVAVATLIVPAVAGVLGWLAGVLNAVLGWVSGLPLASIEGLHPSLLQVAMMYLLEAVFFLILWRYGPRDRSRRV